MTPTQAYTGLLYGIGSGLQWIKKNYGNINPLFKVYGRMSPCKRGAHAEMNRVQRDWQKFGDYFGSGEYYKVAMNGTIIFTSESLGNDSASPLGATNFNSSVGLNYPMNLDGITIVAANTWDTRQPSPVKNGDIISITVGQGTPNFMIAGRQISVTVAGLSGNGMTYVTNPGHVLYTENPNQRTSQIGFVSYDLGGGQIGTFVIAQGSWASDAVAQASSKIGATTEDASWASLLDDIQKDCQTQ